MLVQTNYLCIACGALVGFNEVWGARSKALDFSDRPKIYPKSPVQWGSFYRAIFRPEPGSRLQLSGIGRYDAHSKGRLKVVWDRDFSNIETPQIIPVDRDRHYIYALNFLDTQHSGNYTVGYLVHANCWDLLERRFLGRSAGSDLELLVDICRERFHENPYDIDQFDAPDIPDGKVSFPTTAWVMPEGTWSKCSAFEDSYYRGNVADIDNRRTRHVISLRDPLRIPEISKLIRHSMQNKAREATKRKTRKWSSSFAIPSSSVSSAQTGGRTRSREYRQITQLPLETVLLILDNLSGHVDIRNALLAFNWKVPDSYWRPRVPTDLIFELEDLSSELDDMNWKFFFFAICKLQEESPDLKNRQRVLGLLDEITRRFRARSHQLDN